MTVAITNNKDSKLASAAELVVHLHAGRERSVPASKTYTASLLALALMSQAIDPDDAFGADLARVPSSMAGALKREVALDELAPALSGPRAVVLGRGFNFSTAEEVALKLTETSYMLARAWSIADFEHGPIALVEPGFPVLLVGGGGSVQADLEGIAARLVDYGCHVVGLFDGTSSPPGVEAALVHDSGLPEELTPLTLVVLGQLLAHLVKSATFLGLDIGGSSSRARLVEDGRVVAEAKGPGANVAVLPPQVVESRLGQLLSGMGAMSPDACCAGSAGAEVAAGRERLEKMLATILPRSVVTVVHDARLVLAAAGFGS